MYLTERRLLSHLNILIQVSECNELSDAHLQRRLEKEKKEGRPLNLALTSAHAEPPSCFVRLGATRSNPLAGPGMDVTFSPT